MSPDTFSALWVSHSSISDFLTCPRAYFLKNVYKHPKNGRKIAIMSPPLALGQVVHEVIESLSELPTDRRFSIPLTDRFEKAWEKVTGKRGGFLSQKEEDEYKHRGKHMVKRVEDHPGPLLEKAVKLSAELPRFWLSEQDNVILCGKIDWLQYNEQTNGVRIIDFKTSKSEESAESLQLPMYYLLAHYCQKRPVESMSYWYLELQDSITEVPLPDLQVVQEQILKIAKKIKTARALDKLDCPQGTSGCRFCKPYEAVLHGDAEYLGTDKNRRDMYVLARVEYDGGREEGTIL